jgi:glycogen operon protein
LLLAGDEVGNSQDGNNNAYCQDNPIGWVDWSGLGRDGDDLTALIAKLADLRRQFPQLRARDWVTGRRPDGSFGVLWLTPQAIEMTEKDWNFPEGRFLAYLLAAIKARTPILYVALNASAEGIEFILPSLPSVARWKAVLDTALNGQEGQEVPADGKSMASPRSIMVFASNT